jgi:4-hydroxy-tetrahydrodipicolinate reductase
MNIAILGYGKMGKAVEEMAMQQRHTITARIDSDKDWSNNFHQLKISDVAIEFSTPDAVVSNITRCFHMNLPVVTGTTSWDDRFEEVRKTCIDNQQALFKASNFSLGVQVFYKINQHLASFMNGLEQYDVDIEETHHTMKLDKPSGTARQLAGDILLRLDRKKRWLNEASENSGTIPVISHRIADVSGIHQIRYESDEDIIEIKHTAKSRKGFARGALMAAVWLIGRKGFFTMDDLLADVL